MTFGWRSTFDKVLPLMSGFHTLLSALGSPFAACLDMYFSLHIVFIFVFDILWYLIVPAQVGTLRFCGSTEFSGGLWAGVELDKPEGKNDGSVAGVQYFTCRMKHGMSCHSLVLLKISSIDSYSTFVVFFFYTIID